MTAVIAAADGCKAQSLSHRGLARGNCNRAKRDIVRPADQPLATGEQCHDRGDRESAERDSDAADCTDHAVYCGRTGAPPRGPSGGTGPPDAMYHIGMMETSPGRRLRDAVAVERPLQIAGAINAYARCSPARRLSRALPVRRGGGECLARDAGSRNHDARRCAHRCPAHHRRDGAAAARGCGYRLARRRSRADPRVACGRGGHSHRRPGGSQTLRTSSGQAARPGGGNGGAHRSGGRGESGCGFRHHGADRCARRRRTRGRARARAATSKPARR